MANKTIPELAELSGVNTETLFLVDSGTQTFKLKANVAAQGLRPLMAATIIAQRTSNYSPTVAQESAIVPLNSSAGSFNVQLPAPSTMQGLRITFKDVGGALSSNPVTLLRSGSELFEKVAQDYLLEADYGIWTVYCDGTDWLLI